MPRYKVVIDHWSDMNTPPMPLGYRVDPTVWTGDDAGRLIDVYAVACTALRIGGCYRSAIGVFIYTDDAITDRYLVEDGRVITGKRRQELGY